MNLFRRWLERFLGLKTEVEEQIEQWTIDLRNSITTGERIAEDCCEADADAINAVCKEYPMRIPRYYYNLIQQAGDPIWRQSVASMHELMDKNSPEDPLSEELIRGQLKDGTVEIYLDGGQLAWRTAGQPGPGRLLAANV